MEAGREMLSLSEHAKNVLDELLMTAREMVQQYPHGALASLKLESGQFELIVHDGMPLSIDQ